MKVIYYICIIAIAAFAIISVFRNNHGLSFNNIFSRTNVPSGLYVCELPDENVLMRIDFRKDGDAYLEISTLVRNNQVRSGGHFGFREKYIEKSFNEYMNDPNGVNGSYECRWMIDSNNCVILYREKPGDLMTLTFDNNDLVWGRGRFAKK